MNELLLQAVSSITACVGHSWMHVIPGLQIDLITEVMMEMMWVHSIRLLAFLLYSIFYINAAFARTTIGVMNDGWQGKREVELLSDPLHFHLHRPEN